MIGIGIFAVMTSFLASILIGENDEPSLQNGISELRQENAAMRAQLDAMLQMLAQWQQEEDEY